MEEKLENIASILKECDGAADTRAEPFGRDVADTRALCASPSRVQNNVRVVSLQHDGLVMALGAGMDVATAAQQLGRARLSSGLRHGHRRSAPCLAG